MPAHHIDLGSYQGSYLKGQELVAHTCNPCYTGGGDQEDYNLKPGGTYSKNLSWKYLTKTENKQYLRGTQTHIQI
jgi:hypothetical protein